jgi:hypothetical protein
MDIAELLTRTACASEHHEGQARKVHRNVVARTIEKGTTSAVETARLKHPWVGHGSVCEVEGMPFKSLRIPDKEVRWARLRCITYTHSLFALAFRSRRGALKRISLHTTEGSP